MKVKRLLWVGSRSSKGNRSCPCHLFYLSAGRTIFTAPIRLSFSTIWNKGVVFLSADSKKKNRRLKRSRGASPRNRSLERGLDILRVFRPGVSLRGNNEIAELTGLPRSTVSRLTQTLVACRFLHHDPVANAYQLGAPVLSLAEAYLVDSDVLPTALPLMKRVADKLQVNVGLAVADGDEMVYLHTVRRSVGGMDRHITTGHRIPVELSSLGHAYLATLSSLERTQLFELVRSKHASRWKKIEAGIRRSVQQIHDEGYCEVSWLPGIMSIATSIQVQYRPTYLINIGVRAAMCTRGRMRNELVPELLHLRRMLSRKLAIDVNQP